jgi:large subunit ribosomal protein L32e
MANFQRTKFRAYVKLGSRQKSMRRYKKATGRHNKTRQKWKSRPPMVEIGYKNKVETRGLINGKTPILIHNLQDLNGVQKNNVIIIGKIGTKSKIELAKEIEKRKLEVLNLNIRKFLKKTEKAKKPEAKK